MGPTISDRASPRDQLVAAGVDLFRSYGYAGTGISALLEHAGCARGTFYAHFDGKEALAEACVAAQSAALCAAIEARLARAPDPEARLVAPFEVCAEDSCASGHRGCPILNVLTDFEDTGAAVPASAVAHQHKVATMFAESLGALRPERGAADRRTTARALTALLLGCYVRAKAERSAAPFWDGAHLARQLTV